MGINKAPWACPACGNTWFKKEEHVRLSQTQRKLTYGEAGIVYSEPGDMNYKTVYTCSKCSRVLEELYR